MQQNLSKHYHFESVDRLCEEFNTIVNERKKEEKEVEKDKYPLSGKQEALGLTPTGGDFLFCLVKCFKRI